MTTLVERVNAVELLRLRKYRVGWGLALAWFLSFIGIVIAVTRWINGLGATTALVDNRGWGIWISFDLMTGVPLAAGAFTIAAVVYIFNLKRFYPIIRPTILTGFIGYILAASTLLVDLGFPQRIWHLIVYWNVHSPLFEIGWCVMAYSTVLALEFSPVIFERLGWKAPLKVMRAVTIPLVITGIVLSTMHQSTLGTMLTIAPEKIYPLWYSPLMPLYFYITAIAAGLSMTIVETHFSASVYHYRFEKGVVKSLAKAVPYVLGLYLFLKVGELAVTGKVTYLLAGGLPAFLYLLEILAGVVAPIVLFSLPAVRKDRYRMLWTAMLVLLGLVINRFNASLVFYNGAAYFPSWSEVMMSIGFLSMGLVMYDLAARLFPLFPEEDGETRG